MKLQEEAPTPVVYRSVRHLAGELGIGYHAVYGLLKAGQIPHIKAGRRFILPRAAIRKWLETAGGIQ